MADDPTKRGPADASRINLNEPWELQYWTKKFSVTPEKLREAVKAVGPATKAVQQHLAAAPGRAPVTQTPAATRGAHT